ncbi:MAG: 2-C-methyl-D-erythritol 2,4-cyclodiphosphate synthase [Neisseriaceae bacterium]|nr:2-C-methyl-D-erythritol 2,4-cyclodiphosphate synthase [Neisseriaceae bacterium]
MRMRVGQGCDVHRLVEGRPLILGGVNIPFDKGLEGHSDADALLHAIIDALLGAVGLGDIGSQFPDTDNAYKNADSGELLQQIWAKIQKDGWQINNIDSTIIAQTPKLAEYIPQMKKKIGELLKISESNIGIKAKTNEKLGYLGRSEAIEAQAAVLLQKFQAA